MADSALISEIEIVVITFILAMAAGLWITGAVATFTNFPKPSAYTYADTDQTTGIPRLVTSLSNMGTKSLVIDYVTVQQGSGSSVRITAISSLLEGVPLGDPLPLSIPPGGKAVITVTLSANPALKTVELRLHTTQGTEIIQYVTLP